MLESSYENALERIISYSIFSKYDFTNTISEISETFSIPSDIIRKDFVLLFEQSALKWNIDFDILSKEEKTNLKTLYERYYGKYDGSPDFESFEDELNASPLSNIRTKELIKSGLMDHIPFSIFSFEDDYNSYEQISIPVSVEEYLAYYNLFESELYPKRETDEKNVITSTIRNKKYLCDLNPLVLDNLYSIEVQIKNGGCIKFDYMPYGAPKIINNTVRPLKIGFDATENRYVLLSALNGKIHIHDIERMRKITVQKEAASDPILLNKIPHEKVWGFEYDKCFDALGNIVSPIRVKIMFYHNEANVINKANRDLEYRTPINKYIDESGNLIYEDDIYGKDSFIRWILSYGSSVRILEPQSLVDEFIGILLKLQT